MSKSEYDNLTIKLTMRGKNHWFWDLSLQDKEFCETIGEPSFLRHKYIISKALKKAQNSFTSTM